MKLLFSAIFLLIFLQSHSQYKFELNGTVPASLNNKELIFAIWDQYSLNKFKKQDTILIRQNSFSINGFLNKPSEQAYLLLTDGRSSYFFVVDSGRNDMIIHTLPPESVTKRNKLSDAEVVDSKSNFLQKKIDYLGYENYLEKQKKSNSSDSMALQLSRLLKLKELNLLRQFPDTYYSLIHLYGLSYSVISLETEELLDVFNTLDDKIKDSPLGKELNQKLLSVQSSKIGKTIKPFTAITPTGLAFSNTYLKDTVYLLAFGATWCKPCRENLPELKHIYDKFKGKKFQFVFVNLDGNEKAWKNEIIQYRLKWINVTDEKKWDESAIVKDFGISAIPLYLIIDKSQKIVYNSIRSRNFEPEQMEAIISQLLK